MIPLIQAFNAWKHVTTIYYVLHLLLETEMASAISIMKTLPLAMLEQVPSIQQEIGHASL
jgi:hypothetical protein